MKKSLFKYFFLFASLFSFALLNAQDGNKGNQAVLISPSLAMQSPAEDLAERFGTNYSIGVGAGIKTKSNWIFFADFQYIFGGNVRRLDKILAPMLTDRGYILNQTGNYAQLNIYQRGLYGLLEIEHIFSKLGGVNKNSGPTLSLGAGYIYNWIHYDAPGNDVPQILDEYQKGYDHLSAGPMLKQSIGYTYLSANRRINFKLSFEVLEGFTQDLRKISYSTGKADEGTQLDIRYGIRLNWYLPIYTGSSDEFYYD